MSQSSVTTVSVDTLVVGAGVIGSSVAMGLARLGLGGPGGVRVVDPDLEGADSSSELNAGGVRATFSQPVNVALSRLSIEYFAAHAEEVGYRPVGYLWLRTSEALPKALRDRERWLSAGWPVEAWDVAELRRRVPFIDKTDDLAGAVFAPRDGLVNPNRLKNHFREEARKLGVVFDDRTWVRGATYSAAPGAGGGAVEVEALRWPSALGLAERRALFGSSPEGVPLATDADAGADENVSVHSGAGASGGTGHGASQGAPERVRYRAKRVVNCAGPWAAGLARMLGYASPSICSRRQICLFDCRDVDLNKYGMIIDPTGVYFHPEATNGMAGWARPTEPAGANFEYEGAAFFEEHVWPALYERSTAFERLRHLTGWAGLYEISPDETAILGRVEGGDAGRHGGVYEAHSFSGHGVMQSYAAGVALAELVLKGRAETLDVSMLGARRFDGGTLLHESAVI